MTEQMLKEARATLRVRHRLRRNAYQDERYKVWAQKRVNFIGDLIKKLRTRSQFGVPEGYEKLYSGFVKLPPGVPSKEQQALRISRAKERLVTISSNRSGDSKDFTLLRLNLLIQLASGETLDTLLEYKGNTLGGRMAHRRRMEAARKDEIEGQAIDLKKTKAYVQQTEGKGKGKAPEPPQPRPRRIGSLASYELKTRPRKAKAKLQPCLFCGSTKIGVHSKECRPVVHFGGRT